MQCCIILECKKHSWIYMAWKLGFLIFDFLRVQCNCTQLLVNRNVWGWVKWAIESTSEKSAMWDIIIFQVLYVSSFHKSKFTWNRDYNPSSFVYYCIWSGEGNGNPLQCSCLENPRDGGAWWAAVYGVAQSWTQLKRLSSSSSSSIWSACQHSNLQLLWGENSSDSLVL